MILWLVITSRLRHIDFEAVIRCHTIDSTAKVRIAISANLCWMAPNSAIGDPNALRSLVIFKQMARRFF